MSTLGLVFLYLGVKVFPNYATYYTRDSHLVKMLVKVRLNVCTQGMESGFYHHYYLML